MPWSVPMVLCLIWCVQLQLQLQLLGTSVGMLEVGFYSETCPRAEFIVSSVVKEAAHLDPTIPAALLRLHYHDCIVQGCDGSVLIQKADNPEKNNANHAGLRGFDVIERAKAQLEAQCPGLVSCADIVALAARDSIALSHGPFYQVPTGRRDGLVSNAADAANMPDLPEPIEVIKAKFAEKGLSENDLVLLSAAHTIGTAACFFVERRLYDFLPGGGPDPLINPRFLPELQSRCPKGGPNTVRVPLDHGSERRFDTNILSNIQTGFGVIDSDAKLYTDPSMRSIVDSYVRPRRSESVSVSETAARPSFGSDFVGSIVRMGMIGVKVGAEGEIRRVCSNFN